MENKPTPRTKKPPPKTAKRPLKKPIKPPADEGVEEKKRRKVSYQWEINQELIGEAFFSCLLVNKKFPTYRGLAKKLGLDEKTVMRHLRNTEMFEDLIFKMKALKDKAMITLAVKAIKGESHHWSRLFFEVLDQVGVKEQNSNINNITEQPKIIVNLLRSDQSVREKEEVL